MKYTRRSAQWGLFTWRIMASHKKRLENLLKNHYSSPSYKSGSQRGGPWSPGALKFLLWSPEPYDFTDWRPDPFLAVEPGAQRHFARSPEPSIFKFDHLVPCLSQRKSILINIRACKNFAVYRPRKDILFKTKIDKSVPWLRQKKINSIPCLRQKFQKTYPGWPHVSIKPL